MLPQDLALCQSTAFNVRFSINAASSFVRRTVAAAKRADYGAVRYGPGIAFHSVL
jgi:hypothetical protein